MFKRLFAAALGILGSISSKVTGVELTPPSNMVIEKFPDWHRGYTHAPIPRGFYRQGGTHGSTRIRRFRSLKNKRRHGL